MFRCTPIKAPNGAVLTGGVSVVARRVDEVQDLVAKVQVRIDASEDLIAEAGAGVAES